MLPGGNDALYRSALAAPHRRYVRIEVWSGDGVDLTHTIPAQFAGEPEGGLAFFEGQVEATLTSRVARQLTLSVPMDLYPRETSDLLAPFGNEIRAFMGITLGDGSTQYSWQVFRGRIQQVQMDNSAGVCGLSCSDRASDVVDHGFVSPQNSQTSNSITAEWQRLISDAVPDATFGPSDTFDRAVAPLTWEFDRAAGIDEMLRSVGAIWYPLANGDFVLRKVPWTVANALVFTFTDAPGGTVNSFMAQRSRESIFNVVTVTGERFNGDAPVYATATDSTPGSPTNIDGAFGIKNLLERLQNPTTQGGAQSTAQTLLRAYIAPTEQWQLEMVPDAALELGDAGTLALDDREVIQVVTGFSLPLGLTGNMTVSTRSLVVGSV